MRRSAAKPDEPPARPKGHPQTKNLLLLLFVLSPLAVLTLLCVLIAANLSERADRVRQPAPQAQMPTQPPSRKDAP